MYKTEILITNLKTGKTRKLSLSQVQSERGKKSVKARHKGMSKKDISEYYSKLRKSKKN